MRCLRVGSTLLLPIFPLALVRGQSLPGAPGAKLTTLTPKPGYFTEPSIAASPLDSMRVVAAFQDNAQIAYSTDGGVHWAAASGIAPKNYRVSGDVSVTYDNRGHAILCYIAFDKLGTFNYWGHNSGRNGIFIRRSLDGGATWEKDHIAVSEQPEVRDVPWEDKPYIAADTTHSRYAGNLYIGWTRWTLTDSRMVFSRSTDGGATWTKPIEIDRKRGLPRDDTGALEGFSAAVTPDGAVHAVWSDGLGILLATSRDGGRTFSRPRLVARTAPSMFAVEALERANGFPVIAAGLGRLYLAWSDYRNGDLDVFCISSRDGGRRWTEPVRVNNDAVHNGADQFFHWLAADPAAGAVYLIFYDRRIDPKNREQTVVLARSTDEGQTFANYAWTREPFDAAGVFFGDYTGLAAAAGRVYGAWMEKPRQPRGVKQGTIVRVGVADFTSPPPTADRGTSR